MLGPDPGQMPDRYRPSSCHGIVGSDGTRRCMAGRSIFIGFGGFSGCAPLDPTLVVLDLAPKPLLLLTGFGSDRRSKRRHVRTSRASAASLTASTASIVRHRFDSRKMLIR